MENNQLKVTAIKNGTVLDHIPAENLFKVLDILNITKIQSPITIGSNLESKALGKKGIIKISDKFFADEEINKIALVAPQATINIIKEYQVVEKKVITIPDQVIGIARCANPKCVTNHQPIETKFSTVHHDGETQLLCHYCEKITDLKNLKIISEK